ncbi:MAG: type II secretion system major pseudopilin GspG [Alphaproteobacteria bacterium]|jgi:general secretion pathway protein G
MRLRSKRRNRQAGFTLIELLVVLVILGLIIGIVAPRAVNFLSRAKSDVARIQIESFATALDLFQLDVGRYPATREGLDALIARPGDAARWNGPYLRADAVPLDPWDHAYRYELLGESGKPYRLLSLGADGQPGGEGEDADIVN